MNAEAAGGAAEADLGDMADDELLSLVLGSGKRTAATDGAAKTLLARCGSLYELSSCGMGPIAGVRGAGGRKALRAAAAFELGRRAVRAAPRPESISSPGAAHAAFAPLFAGMRQECFKAALLDTKLRVLAIADVSLGTLNSSPVHARDVFRKAVVLGAHSIVVAHNHPSGDPTPSESDREATKSLTEAGKILGIPVSDHIIVGDACFYSFREDAVKKAN
jgi:DNA repair protein RadC